ncbi:MAG: ABC transporter ATP-binding protein [Planctomycetota bacterium]
MNRLFQSTSPTILAVRDARLTYGRVSALRGVCLELLAGEILGLLGPNGAGKTSLLRCLAGHQKLDSGSFESSLEGDFRESLGMVPQEIALYRDLTVLQNLDVFARFQNIASASIMQEALLWAGLEDKARTLVRHLSGGMQRRLNIACSILHDPEILCLDEPTVGVDPQSRERIYHMLQSLLDRGTAILLTTHHLEEAEDRCDRIAIIDQGQILDVGTLEELMSRTVGSAQHLSIQFLKPPSRVPAPLRLREDRLEATCEIANASTELPALLSHIQQAKLPVESVSLRNPTLQTMFLHMTGKELRE